MRDHHDEIDQALNLVSDTVADQLAVQGWRQRTLDDRYSTTLTLPARDGAMSVAEIRRRPLFRWPDDWPVTIEVRLGMGYEPALNLMPLLSMGPHAILVDDPERGCDSALTVTLAGADSVATTAQQIVRLIGIRSATLAESFPDAAAIEAQLRRNGTSLDERDPRSASRVGQVHLVVLAAMGRHDEARTMLIDADDPTSPVEDSRDRAHRRFVRQLTRWLDAGGPTAPPVEETLARLPQRPRPPRPSWSDARAKSNASKDALDAARKQAHGKQDDQLRELIVREWSRRGLEISRSGVEFYTDQIQLEQLPFGRALSALKGVHLLISGGKDIARGIRTRSAEKPDWLRLPDRASYPMIAAGGDRYTAVELDGEADDFLDRLRGEAPSRLGPFLRVDSWLSRTDTAGPLAVHLGAQRVGRIRDKDVDRFAQVMSAAAIFDEDPFVHARFVPGERSRPNLLEIPLPAE